MQESDGPQPVNVVSPGEGDGQNCVLTPAGQLQPVPWQPFSDRCHVPVLYVNSHPPLHALEELLLDEDELDELLEELDDELLVVVSGITHGPQSGSGSPVAASNARFTPSTLD
jgi:hypothetical protein